MRSVLQQMQMKMVPPNLQEQDPSVGGASAQFGAASSSQQNHSHVNDLNAQIKKQGVSAESSSKHGNHYAIEVKKFPKSPEYVNVFLFLNSIITFSGKRNQLTQEQASENPRILKVCHVIGLKCSFVCQKHTRTKSLSSRMSIKIMIKSFSTFSVIHWLRISSLMKQSALVILS